MRNLIIIGIICSDINLISSFRLYVTSFNFYTYIYHDFVRFKHTLFRIYFFSFKRDFYLNNIYIFLILHLLDNFQTRQNIIIKLGINNIVNIITLT